MTYTAILRTSLAAIATLTTSFASAQGDAALRVTSPADSGNGTLRAALAQADGQAIIITMPGPILIDSTLTYAGDAPLTIIGSGQDIINSTNTDVLAILNGTAVNLSNVHLRGPGGFSIENRDTDRAGKGLFVDVDDAQTGTVEIYLHNLGISDVAGHGIHISDCDLADECGGGEGGTGGGSAAGISVRLENVYVNNVGHGDYDADGLRVDERGDGHITAMITNSSFNGIGADGIELDEGQDGSVVAELLNVGFDNNGDYCQIALLEDFVPSPDEAEFDQGLTKLADIPAPITGTPDNRCIERTVDLYDDGSVAAYEFAIDLDDAFDIDEAGPGHIIARLTDIEIESSLDEGLDFDEHGRGDIDLALVNALSANNTDDGYKLSEADDGDVNVTAINSKATDNGGKGFVFEEEGSGDVDVTMIRSSSSGNDDSDYTGLEVVQDDDGTGTVRVINSNLRDGIDIDGAELSNE